YDGNIIRGGYYGVYHYGQSGSPYTASYGDVWNNNRFTQQYYYGAYDYYGYQNKYTGNYFDSTTYTQGYPWLSYYENGVTFENNVLPGYNAYYGLFIAYVNYYVGSTASLI